MTEKHQTPEFHRNARTIRNRTRSQLKFGNPVPCWRCGQAILPGMPFDVGHIDPNGGNRMTNLAPEHRFQVGRCRGNRSYGGTDGAAVVHGRQTQDRSTNVRSWLV